MNKKASVITIIGLILLWWVFAGIVHNDILIPYPHQVIQEIISLCQTDTFYLSILSTLKRICVGWIVSCFLAFIISIVCNEYPKVRAYLNPIFILIRTIPNVSYIIIALIWLGAEGSVTAISFMILFPIFLNGFMNALDRQDERIKQLPMIYPDTFSKRLTIGLLPILWDEVLKTGRTAISMGLKVGVMAEILGQVQVGIGRRINYDRLALNTTGVIAWTIIMIALAIGIDHIFKVCIDIKNKEEM